MSNDTGTMVTRLSTALRDTAYATWSNAELTDIVNWRLASLWPDIGRVIDATSKTIALTTDVYFYPVPTDVRSISRLDAVDSAGYEMGPIAGADWEITGDLENGTAQIHVSPSIVIGLDGGILRINGYGAYDGTAAANYIPMRLVPLILAEAREEAYRRLGSDRERYQDWLSRNANQNVSVNELLQFVREAEAEANELRSKSFTWKLPVEARVF